MKQQKQRQTYSAVRRAWGHQPILKYHQQHIESANLLWNISCRNSGYGSTIVGHVLYGFMTICMYPEDYMCKSSQENRLNFWLF